MSFIIDNILTLLIFIPFLTGIFILIFPIKNEYGSFVSFLSSIIVLILNLILFFSFNSTGKTEFSQSLSIVEEYGISYMVGVDGISLMMLIIISFSLPILYLLIKTRNKGYWANMLLMQSSFMAVVLAEDLIFFYAGWEAMLLPIFVLVGMYGKANDKARVAFNLIYYTMFGSLFMFLAIVYTGVLHFNQFGFYSFAIQDLEKIVFTDYEEALLFFAFMFAFAIKIPLFPFHMWMPDSYVKAPIGATFALSAIASKVAVCAIIKFVLLMFPKAFVEYSSIFIYLGIFSMAYFAYAALCQSDLKRALAYSSASHLGLIVTGVFSLNEQAMVGGIYQIVAHAISTGILFLLTAKIAREIGTRDMDNLGGLVIKAPIFAVFFAIALLSSVGLPSTNGFIGEFLILLGVFKYNYLTGFLATSSIILGAAYMFKIYRKVVFENVNPLTKNFTDLSFKHIMAFLPIIILIFVMGIYPKPFIKRIEPTVNKQFKLYINPYLNKDNK